jgi:hypothetical protein
MVSTYCTSGGCPDIPLVETLSFGIMLIDAQNLTGVISDGAVTLKGKVMEL